MKWLRHRMTCPALSCRVWRARFWYGAKTLGIGVLGGVLGGVMMAIGRALS